MYNEEELGKVCVELIHCEKGLGGVLPLHGEYIESQVPTAYGTLMGITA